MGVSERALGVFVGKPIEIPFDSIVWPDNVEPPWDYSLYKELVKREGEPYGITDFSLQLNQPFFVAKFAKEHLVIHEPELNQFFTYNEERGLWQIATPNSIKTTFSQDLKVYADSQRESAIERKRTNALLEGLTSQLKGLVEHRDAFAQRKRIIHLKNGMLHLDVTPPELREFSPSYYSRNQCPFVLVKGADCPRFKEELLASALDNDDISLVQRWCGSLLIGGNRAQRIMLMTGTPGGGKSTLVEIIEMIVGLENVTELRTEHLNERFELFKYIGKTLLTGKDVPAEFLMRKGAPVLKKLVGHDLLTPEGKRLNTAQNIRGEFDVVITCNSRLKVRLEGDAEAWRRRLLVIEYERPKPKNRILGFPKLLLATEAEGILLWMIQGALEHDAEANSRGDFVLTETQQRRVDVLLAESDSVREFVRTGLKHAHPGATVTTEGLCFAYSQFCVTKDWHPEPPAIVEKRLRTLIEEIHGITQRHDLKDSFGVVRRGYKGLQISSSYES
jgi:putative DNA primase/helicase